MALLKQSTAYTRAFQMIDTTDHIAGKASASPVVNISKAGAAFGAAAGAITELVNGFYKIALTTADTNTLGDLAYYITGTGADPTGFIDQVSVQIEADLMATYAQPTGFLAATFPSGTIANTTNITAGTITTTTNLTNLPSIPTNWITAAGITAAALNGKGDWATVNPTNLTAAQIATGVWTDTVAGDFTTVLSIGKSVMNGVSLGTGLTVASVSGAVGSVTGAVGSVTAAVTLPTIPANWISAAGIAAGALNGKGDWNIGKTGYTLVTQDWFKVSDYTAPDNTSVTAIKVQTDKLAFNVANQVNSNITYVNAVKVNGLGTAGTPWGP